MMPTEQTKFILIQFIQDLFSYIYFRIRQTTLFLWALAISLTDIFASIKAWSVRRMYWGRGSFYRSVFHIIVFSLTLLSLVIGISERINIVQGEKDSGLVLSSGVVGNYDTLNQTGTAETITAQDEVDKPWRQYTHVVKTGESLEYIAEQYGVTTATIKWANNLSSDNIRPDQVLTIPGINGVLYTVKKGDTIKKIISSGNIDNINEFDVVELNNINPPDAELAEGSQIFIPNGIVKPPKITVASNGYTGDYIQLADPGINVPSGTFVNPLSFCPGYIISRGVSSFHTGVDMAKSGGCTENAAADGTVTAAQWASDGRGFYVQIDHHNGFVTMYYHGKGIYYVKKGDNVKAGQRIMEMGCTGHCTGTHLHFEMHYKGALVDPEKYVKLR